MGWLHWLAPVVGVLFLGYLWIFLDGAMRHPGLRRHPPIEGTVIFLLVAALYVALADPPGHVLRLVDRMLFVPLALGSAVAVLAWFGVVRLPRLPWRPPGPWSVLLFGLPELITPVAGVVAVWRRTAPLRWCLRHPRTYRAFRRLGHRAPRVVAAVARWFRPDQVRRLGWDAATVSAAVDHFRVTRGDGWDAEAFVRTVLASGRDHAGQLRNWGMLHRLGVHDPTEYLRYVAAADDLGLARVLSLALGPDRVPYDMVVALKRRRVTGLALFLYALQREFLMHRTCYRGGWADLVAWVEHDDSREFAAAVASVLPDWQVEACARRWRAWEPVSGRSPRLPPALWAAAGFTVEETLAVLDSGDEPDAEALRGLAALRRTG